jgi:hypothetical protein
MELARDGHSAKQLLLTIARLAARGENRLAQKPGQPPYFAYRKASIESTRVSMENAGAKYGGCPRLLRFGPFCHGLLGLAWLALAIGYAQPPLAKDPGPFLPARPPGEDRGPKPVAGPAPHLPDGRPDFGGDGA